jgi:hypothetical protein
MVDALLSIPYSIPLLGEAFTAVKNPMLLASLDLFMDVRVTHTPQEALELPIACEPLRVALGSLLEGRGVRGRFKVISDAVDGVEKDFVTASALLYLAGAEELEPDLPLVTDRLDGDAFIILARALTSLSGGFVVCRRGEGLVSVEGSLDACVHLRLRGHGQARGNNLRGKPDLFSESFDELAGSLWHLLGHLVLEGGKAVRQSDAPLFGRLLTLESSLAHAAGLVGLRELCRISRPAQSLGGKIVCSGGLRGELILMPKETLPLPSYSRLTFTAEGVSKSGHG